MDDKILIILRHSTTSTRFNEGTTIKHLIEKDKIKEVLINLFKLSAKELKDTNFSKVDIKFKGESIFNYLIADIFWNSLVEPHFLFKKRNKIMTFISKKVNLTIIDFDIIE